MSPSRVTVPPRRAAIGLACLVSLSVAMLMRHHGIDLEVYRSGARALTRGHFLYSTQFGAHHDPQLLFTYPPFGAAIFAPTLFLGSAAAIWFWNLLTLALLGWLIREVTPDRSFRSEGGLYVLVVLGIMVWTMPVIDHLGFGQVNILLYAFCCYDVLHGPSRRIPARYRGIFVGIASAVKLLPGLFIVYLWAIGRRADACRAAIAFGLCTLVTACVFPVPSTDFWFHALRDTGRVGGNDYFSNQSLNGLLSRIGGPEAHDLFVGCAIVVCAVGIRWAAGAYRRENQAAGFLLIGMTINVVSPVSWIHHLIPLCLTLLYLAVLPGASRLVRGYVAVATVLLVLRLPYLGDIAVRGHAHGGWHLIGLPLRETYLALTLVSAVVLARLTAVGPRAAGVEDGEDGATPRPFAWTVRVPVSRRRRPPFGRPSTGERMPAGPG